MRWEAPPWAAPPTVWPGRPPARLPGLPRWLAALNARAWGGHTAATESDGAAGATGDAASADDARSFEEFYRRYERDVFGYLWRMTGDSSAADDLSQEAFYRAWRHFARVRTYEQPRAWLLRVATNLVINQRRGARHAPPLPLDEHHASPGAPDPATGLAEGSAIRQALSAIAPRERAALVLHEVYGLTCDELAEALGISRGAAKMTLSRGRAHFRTAYVAQNADEETRR